MAGGFKIVLITFDRIKAEKTFVAIWFWLNAHELWLDLLYFRYHKTFNKHPHPTFIQIGHWHWQMKLDSSILLPMHTFLLISKSYGNVTTGFSFTCGLRQSVSGDGFTCILFLVEWKSDDWSIFYTCCKDNKYNNFSAADSWRDM